MKRLCCLTAVALLAGCATISHMKDPKVFPQRPRAPLSPANLVHGVWVIGHRGASADAPENTVEAFELAATQGAQMIEFDVLYSKDRVPVVIHDDTVDRTTNGHGLVGNLTWAEISRLDAGSWMAPKFKNVRIPKLETVLERMKEKVAMNIELKTESRVSPGMKPADIVRPVLELVKKKELELAVMVSSFDHQLVDEVKRQNPKIICAYLIEGGEDQLRPDTLRQKGIEGMNPRWDLVDEAVVADYRSRGVGVYVWGSDDSPRILNELIDMGVSGIFTNKPAVMLGLLKARSSR